MAQYEPPAPPICLRGALESCSGAYDERMTAVDSNYVGRFDQKLAAQRSAAISPTEQQQLESQLPQARPGPAAGHTPAGAVYRSWRPVAMRNRAYTAL
jgi:hypothetical protein